MKAIIITNQGRYLDLLDPDPDAICIEDIAHGLAHINRFNGHTDTPYSVAQHSLYCSDIVSRRHAFQALMHDATEAYVGDMVSPLKAVLPEFQAIEDRLWAVIADVFNIPVKLHPEVKWADAAAYRKERVDLLRSRSFRDDPDYERFEDVTSAHTSLLQMTPETAKKEFLDYYRRLE